ncbi:uncharacterized protein SCHCODRAFT_02535442 [Schizophyllum commune H4-8]|nr:uncharacterized protein SCHCODRAFT_02535442 [Schizophyllum commune H4-8]KAI5894995.1 hypothetical protein SCHCODRAFT_02535442 [Schizophyllum commune H4-8]
MLIASHSGIFNTPRTRGQRPFAIRRPKLEEASEEEGMGTPDASAIESPAADIYGSITAPARPLGRPREGGDRPPARFILPRSAIGSSSQSFAVFHLTPFPPPPPAVPLSLFEASVGPSPQTPWEASAVKLQVVPHLFTAGATHTPSPHPPTISARDGQLCVRVNDSRLTTFFTNDIDNGEDLYRGDAGPQQVPSPDDLDALDIAQFDYNSLGLDLPLDLGFELPRWAPDTGASTMASYSSQWNSLPPSLPPHAHASTPYAPHSRPVLGPVAPCGDYDQFGAPQRLDTVGHYTQPGYSIPMQSITDPAMDDSQWYSYGAHASPALANSSPSSGSPSSADSPLPVTPKVTVNDRDGSYSPGARYRRSPSAPNASRDDFEAALALPMRAAGPFIPQRMYTPTTRADRQRYVEDVHPEPSIYFWHKDGENCGISLVQALKRATHELRDPDAYIFNGVRPSVSIRLEWPGYRQWTKQIPAKDFKKVPAPITREKLAKEVAKCVKRFIESQKPLPSDEANRRWRVGGANGIKLEDLILVSMHHVSRGSWQPQLRLRSPRN